MLSKLRRRFIFDTMLLTMVVVIGATALLIVSSYYYEKNTSQEEIATALSSVNAETVSWESSKNGSSESIHVNWDEVELVDESAILILSEDNELLAMRVMGKSFQKKVDENVEEIKETLASLEEGASIIDTDVRYMKQPLEGVGTKVMLLDRSEELEVFYYQFRMYVSLAFILLILIMIISAFLAQRSITPVDEAIRTQQQFIADASHELKTPIAVMLANLDIINSHKGDTIEESQKWLDSTKSEAIRMSKLVEEMLFLARSDAAMDMNYNFRLINFSEAVEEVVLTTEALAYERNIKLESDIAENSQVVGDFERLKQVVMILIENATKYVEKDGVIEVKLTTSPRRSEILTVTNTGTSIPPEKAEHIFERFYRVDESRVREQGGYGLGLSIAQKIVEKHNGEIALDYSNETGTRFSVKLPHAQSLKAPDLTR